MTAAEADVIAMAAAEVEEGKDKPDRQEVEILINSIRESDKF
jgi:hypothetical protein